MLLSYEDSVLQYMEEDGLIAPGIRDKLLDEHSTTIEFLIADGYEGHPRDPVALLDWMGYSPELYL